MPPIKTANTQLAPVYNQADQTIGAQLPAIQSLYAALLQGLQGQAGNQAQAVVDSAAQRGVDRPMLAGDVQAGLADVLAMQSAQLGAQQAQTVAGVQGERGRARVYRAQNAGQLAGTINSERLGAKGNKQQLSNLKRNANLELTKAENQAQLQMLKAQQDYSVKEAAYQQAQAEAAAKAAQAAAARDDPANWSEDKLTRKLRLDMNALKGKKDGHVAPETLAAAYIDWDRSGLEPWKFWKNFQGNWNPKQKTYKKEFDYFLAHPDKIGVR